MKIVETKEIAEGIDKVIEGVKKTVAPIKSTMGAKGKFVIIKEKDGSYRVTKDGVSVAESISLEDPLEDVGCVAVKSSAKKTVDSVGDGTTGTSVLLEAILLKSRKYLEDCSINELVEGMDLCYDDILTNLKFESKKVKDLEKLKEIATIASNSKDLGGLIYNVYKEVGLDSLVQLEKSSFAKDTYYEVLQGVDYQSGMVHESFKNSPGKKCILQEPYIKIEHEEIRQFDDYYLDLLQHCSEQKIPLVILAPSFSKEFVRTVVMNRKRSNLDICLIKAPGFGHNVIENFKDINSMLNIEGFAKKIVIDLEKFIIFPHEDSKLNSRLEELKEYMENVEDEYEYNKTKERIHKLQGSTAIIYTGGNLLEDQGEEYDRLEDALGSVSAAIRGGYVLGGGLALFNAAKKAKRQLEGDIQLGYNIVKEACKKPLQQILLNANEKVDVIIEGVYENQGYNVLTRDYVDFIKEGIIDPLLVIQESLTNALTTCKLLINTKFIINNER